MKILLVADKENDFIWDHFDPERYRDIELIISCGDLQPSYLSFLVTMINVPLFMFTATTTPFTPIIRLRGVIQLRTQLLHTRDTGFSDWAEQ